MNNSELSFEITKLYADKKCKHCYGRGYLVFNQPREMIIFEQKDIILETKNEPTSTTSTSAEVDLQTKILPKDYADYCYCVRKNLRKAADKVHGH